MTTTPSKWAMERAMTVRIGDRETTNNNIARALDAARREALEEAEWEAGKCRGYGDGRDGDRIRYYNAGRTGAASDIRALMDKEPGA